jgi:hypothetical protein
MTPEGKRRARSPRILSVTYEAERQKDMVRFSVPVAALEAVLGTAQGNSWHGREVRLLVERAETGERLPIRTEQLTSGNEVLWHGPYLRPYEPIRVTVSKP